MRTGGEIHHNETKGSNVDHGMVTEEFKNATPKRGSINVIRWAHCRICGEPIRQYDNLPWIHAKSRDEAC